MYGWDILCGISKVPTGHHQWNFLTFPGFFLTKYQFLLILAAPKYDILTFEGIHMHHTDAKKLLQWSFDKIYMICHFYVP